MNTEFDVIVVGGGPAGENAADVAARDGLRVALVERELLGGECSYWACMPSKGLLRPGQALDEARRVPGTKGALDREIDLGEAFSRRDDLASNWSDEEQADWLIEVGVSLLRGTGKITGEKMIEVEDEDGNVVAYQAQRAVVVATGTAASVPPVPGLSDIEFWDNRDITTKAEVPQRLLILGGGVVGVEMAQAWKQLGSEEVTILELGKQLLDGEEPFVGDELGQSLERMGVVIHTSAETQSFAREGDGEVTAEVKLNDGKTISIKADELLVATGRQPNTAELGLESVGLEAGSEIAVDDQLLATGVDGGWLYAVGDVNGRSLLTHTGKYQARIAGAHINGRETKAWGDQRAIPRVVFTTPEIAAVGLTEMAAEKAGIPVRVVKYDIGKTAAAPIVGKGYRGTCQLIIDADKEIIVGATFVGPRVGEMLHAATIAIVGEIPLSTLWHAIPSFPTLSEVWLRLLETYQDEFKAAFR